MGVSINSAMGGTQICIDAMWVGVSSVLRDPNGERTRWTHAVQGDLRFALWIPTVQPLTLRSRV